MSRPASNSSRSRTMLDVALAAAIWLAALPLGPFGALAAELHIIAPSAPGTGWDHLAQALKLVLTDERGETAVHVTNVPGAGGTVGLSKFISDATDDTLLVTGLTMVNAAALHRLPSGPASLTPVARLSAEPFAVAVSAASPFKTIDDIAMAMRADPSKITWAGGPVGSIDHAAAIVLSRALAVPPDRLGYAPFLTSHDAGLALIDGQVAALIVPIGEVMSEARSGRLRILAVSATDRVPAADAPTLREYGIPLELMNWRGILARSSLSPAGRSRLLAQIESVVASRTWRDLMERRGWQTAFLPGDEFGSFIQAEQLRMKMALKMAGLLRRSGD